MNDRRRLELSTPSVVIRADTQRELLDEPMPEGFQAFEAVLLTVCTAIAIFSAGFLLLSNP